MTPTRQRLRRIVVRLSLLLLAGVLVFTCLSWYSAYRLTGPRSRLVGPPPANSPFPMIDVAWKTSDDHTIRGWFVPAGDSERAIVLLHGYGGDRTVMLSRARFFRQHGYNVLLYDARACGESSGNVITMGYHETRDLEGGLELLRAKGIERVACLGISQGGATILLAAEKLADVRCVICESSYAELERALDRRFRNYIGIPGALGGCLIVPFAELRTGVALHQVKPFQHIGKLPCPVFLISGDKDDRTLPEDTQRLFEAARAPKELWMIAGAGHHDLYGPEYEGRVLKFLERCMR